MVFGAIHRSGCGRRESPLPPAILHGAQDSVGCPRGESRDSGPGTHEVRVHAVRLGGRRRLDASSVLSAGRLQGLVAREGASRKEARNHRLTRGRAERRRSGAHVSVGDQKFALMRLAGFGSRSPYTTEGVPGLSPVLLSPVRRRGVLRLEGQIAVAPSARSVSRSAHRSAKAVMRNRRREPVGRAFE